jgi:hypothetical protein
MPRLLVLSLLVLLATNTAAAQDSLIVDVKGHILAYRIDGKPLAASDGRWRLIVPDDLRGARAVKLITAIRVRAD